ncbi:MAG: cell division protein [Rhodospirillaceae bacterium]|nr:MAG: cell division protein [Rhodospirillaceae bacterium]
MFSRPVELQFRRDPAARTLPWIIALMVFLAGLALSGALSIGVALERWDRGLSGTVTVQLLPPGPGDSFPGTFGDRLARTLEILQQTPGVLRAEALTDGEIATLLEPWLNSGDILQELPLPKLIDVTLDTAQPPNLAKLEAQLAAEVPGASLDDHKRWSERLTALARILKFAAGFVVLLTGLTAVAMIIFTTHTGLAIHQNTIALLHTFGARDSYIATQFQSHAMRVGFRGGAMGAALAALTIFITGRLVESLDIEMLSGFSLATRHWIAIAALPIATAFIAMLAARITVLRKLSRML